MYFKSIKTLLVALIITTSAYSNVYTVTSALGNEWDPNVAGSFFLAITNANFNPGRDTIEFNLPGNTLLNGNNWDVTTVTEEVYINGYSTQAGNGAIRIQSRININTNNCLINGCINVVTGNQNYNINGNSNTVSNFSITNNDNHSIYITGNNNIVSDGDLTNNGTTDNHGINLFSGTGNQITNINIASNGHGITVAAASSANIIDGCTITQSGALNPSNIGVVIRGAGNNIIKNTEVHNINHNGIGLLDNAANNIIDSCVSRNNLWAGIAFGDSDAPFPETPSSSNAVSNSSFHDNGSHGVIVGGSSINNTFQKTRVYGNSNDANAGGINDYQFAGIYIKGANTTIDSCYVYDNRGNGILLNDNAGTGLAANCTIRNSLVGMNPSGNLAGNGWNGLMVRYSTGVVIEDCIVVDNGKLHTAFPDRISGIRFQDLTGGTIRNNFIGTTAGKLNGGNDFDGITLHTNVSSVTITGNTINFNGLSSSIGAGGGIALRINSNNNTIQSNYIGMHPDLTDAGNNDYGISVEGCSGNMIGGVTANLGNNIGYSKNAGNKGCGVWISQAGATANELYNNNISFNTGDGVLIENGAAGNTIGSITAGNIINSNVIGINVKDNGASPTNVNSLRGNSFSCNTTEGIQLSDNGNNLYGGIGASKIVTTNASETRPTFVSGTAPANAAVDIYSRDIVCAVACDDTISQGVTYVTTVPADPTGAWEFDFSGTSITQVNVIVMATDTAAGANPQNSSEFSVCAVTCTAPQNVTIAGDDICVGGSETLVANSTGINPTGTYQYYWYLGSVALANEITPRNAPNDSDIVVSTAGTYIVVASETKDSAACSNTSPDFTFRVNALPVVTVNSETVCFGDAATFTATSDSTASDYLWSEQATGTGNVNAASGNTAGNYTVQITDINECIASATGVLTVNPLPTINFTDPTPSFCSGGSVQVNVSTDPGVTIVWSPTGEITNQITVTSAGVLIITATDGSPAGCISIDSITVVEDFLPIINLAKGTFCKGSSMTFDAGNAGKDFAWTPDNQTTQTITASVQGTYTVVVTDPVTGCFDQSSAFAEENPDADPEISISGNDSICFAQGETTELTATLTGGLDGRLEWSNGITEDLITTYSDTVTVWVMYTDTFNCADADTLQIYNYCEPRLDTLPNIFIPGGCPTCNPTFTPIGNLTPADVLSGHMEIYDRWGLLMYKTNDLVPEWDGKYNGRVVSSGVYFWIWQYTDVSRTYYNLNGFVEVLKKK